MEITRKCKDCGKELGYFEGHQIPIFIPASPSFPLPSGGVELYCGECYKDVIGETFLEEEKLSVKKEKDLSDKFLMLREREPKIVSINNAKLGANVTITGIIDSDIQHKKIVKENRTLKMSSCKIRDDTGELILILWDNITNTVENNKMYKVQGYIQEFNGKKQITLGYKGKIEEVTSSS